MEDVFPFCFNLVVGMVYMWLYQADMFLGGAFRVKQVSIKALWWLALSFAMIVSAALSLLARSSMKLGSVFIRSFVGFGGFFGLLGIV